MNASDEPASADAGEPGASDPASGEPASPRGGPDVIVAVMPGVSARPESRWVHQRLRRALTEIDGPIERVSVLIVNDDRMRALHGRYMGDPTPTDVLTFPATSPGEGIDVDIAVSIDEATRQARRRGHPPTHELLLYAVHGVLHCAGYDDRDPASYEAMHREEDRILQAVGLGPTFGPADDTGEPERGR